MQVSIHCLSPYLNTNNSLSFPLILFHIIVWWLGNFTKQSRQSECHVLMGTVSLDRPGPAQPGTPSEPYPRFRTHFSPAQAFSPSLSGSTVMLLCSARLCFTPWLNFGPILPLASRQPCLTNTPGSEIKLRRGIFSFDLAVTATSAGLLPGKRAGGARLPRAMQRRRGGGTRLASEGCSHLLLRRPRTCQGVSHSLSSFFSITQRNADCCMPHPCRAAVPPSPLS